jgi:DNA-directed RNA polymerase specialized sigma24 family protein
VHVDHPRRLEAFLDQRVRPIEVDRSTERREQRHACLDRCLQSLSAEQRELAIEYYRDARRQRIERRRALAARLSISMNALAIRACRVRDALRRCVDACGLKE